MNGRLRQARIKREMKEQEKREQIDYILANDIDQIDRRHTITISSSYTVSTAVTVIASLGQTAITASV